jgi:hypothetical protein
MDPAGAFEAHVAHDHVAPDHGAGSELDDLGAHARRHGEQGGVHQDGLPELDEHACLLRAYAVE